MQPSLKPLHKTTGNWNYASLTVLDGRRELRPAQVGFDRLIFTEPPHLASGQVEIILRNGDAEQRYMATVLPHDPEASRVPIQLI